MIEHEAGHQSTDEQANESTVTGDPVSFTWTSSTSLGKGAFGEVFQGIDASGNPLAVKVRRVGLGPDRVDELHRAMREVQNAAKLEDTTGVVPILYHEIRGENLIVVMPLGGPDLERFTAIQGPMNEIDARNLLLACLGGLRSLAALRS